MNKDKKMKLEKLLENECWHYEDDCSTCPFYRECEEYKEIIRKEERR